MVLPQPGTNNGNVGGVGGDGHIYAFDPKQGKWVALCGLHTVLDMPSPDNDPDRACLSRKADIDALPPDQRPLMAYRSPGQ